MQFSILILVLLALMALQFRRYPDNLVFAFDFGGSIRAAALACGGDWHDLGGGLTEGATDSVSLQPLARIQEVPERAWAADWIVAILMREGVTISPEVKEHLWTALTSLASAPVSAWTRGGSAAARAAPAKASRTAQPIHLLMIRSSLGGEAGRARGPLEAAILHERRGGGRVPRPG